ncbi:hypothetical protein ILUMI_01182 [Ignelater luminosus]|uniref:Uncharacterized protein n=1 Tax=Ignelater luminosus TaxID=2038154 RepID=A0A8K0DKT2_IGNLU|nr:hypothetical protein ILUMI_01182 [Ignelater luminosus]
MMDTLRSYVRVQDHETLQDPVPGCSRGRPKVFFTNSSLKTKRRRVEKLVNDHSLEELTFEALALYLDLNLSERKYNILRCVISVQGKDINVNYQMLFTMLDGSTINILSKTNATQNCFICGASPKEMHLKSVAEKPVNYENLRFGLSSLHSWQARGPEKKTLLEDRKKHIQAEFKAGMKLVVDKPKLGYGSTNGGTGKKLRPESRGVYSDGVSYMMVQGGELGMQAVLVGGVTSLGVKPDIFLGMSEKALGVE